MGFVFVVAGICATEVSTVTTVKITGWSFLM